MNLETIKFYIKRIYRLTLSFEQQEAMVWKEIKKLHTDSEWKSGVYEKEKVIETVFKISEDHICAFYYMIYDGKFHCRVKILEFYPAEMATDLFILASHFNNLLINGVIVVNVSGNYVEYHQKRDVLIPLLYNGEIQNQITGHYGTAKDIYSAFQRLIIENEAPAIIIADILNKNEKENEKDG